jgi:hypothetical protein
MIKQMKKTNYTAPKSSSRVLQIIAVLLIGLLGTYLYISSHAQTTAFVKRSGTQLTVNGNPWRMTGYNAGITSRVGYYCGEVYNDAEVGSLMDRVQQYSKANTLRVWYLQSMGGPQDWSRFDVIVNAAKARNMNLVVTLGNQWGDCEPQVNGAQHKKLLSWYQNGYRVAGDNYPLAYRDFVRQVVQRYANEPAVAMWQLMNEAEAPTNTSGSCDEISARNAIRAFADDIVGVIHSVDANHLISLGTIGSGQCGTSGSTGYQYVHAGLIDVCEIHNYGVQALSGDQWNGVQVRINDCRALNKPIFNGEDGISIPSEAPDTATRARYFDTKFATQISAGIVGDLVWSLSSTDPYDVNAGDPLEAVMAKYADPSVTGSTSTDATAPTVQITTPVSGSTVQGTVNINATASDNIGVTKVEFYIDGRLTAANTTAPYSYPWNTTGLTGSHTIQAKAYDSVGNIGSSNTISVSVTATNSSDTTPPTITISSPANGIKVQGKVTISSTSSDFSGVSSMEIRIDGKLYASGFSDTLSVSWNTNPKSVGYGAHTITVTAKDINGNTTTKSVTVYK